jgi:ornithine--oxo-acid transaminase/putrescine aminotransferase
MAALELLTDERIARVRELGARLQGRLRDALSASPLFREVRGAGFMQGVALHQPEHPWLSMEHFGFPELQGEPVISPLVCSRLYRRGFFCFTCGHDWSIFRMQPRFDVPVETLDAFVGEVADALAYVESLS